MPLKDSVSFEFTEMVMMNLLDQHRLPFDGESDLISEGTPISFAAMLLCFYGGTAILFVVCSLLFLCSMI